MSEEGKKYFNTTEDDMETIKTKLSEEDLMILDTNCKREGMKAERQIMNFLSSLHLQK